MNVGQEARRDEPRENGFRFGCGCLALPKSLGVSGRGAKFGVDKQAGSGFLLRGGDLTFSRNYERHLNCKRPTNEQIPQSTHLRGLSHFLTTMNEI